MTTYEGCGIQQNPAPNKQKQKKKVAQDLKNFPEEKGLITLEMCQNFIQGLFLFMKYCKFSLTNVVLLKNKEILLIFWLVNKSKYAECISSANKT